MPLRENKAAISITFPSGFVFEKAAEIQGQVIKTITDGTLKQPNIFFDNRAGFHSKTQFISGGVQQDFDYSVTVPYEFKSGAGANDWKKFKESKHKRKFRASDSKAQMRMEVNNNMDGEWQGPWKPKT